MNIRLIGYHLSKIIGILGLSMCIPLTLSYIYQENVHDYFITPVIISLLISLFSIKKREEMENIPFRESIVLVFFTWVSVSIIGALPFYISHYFPSYIASLFESISGFTATGSTVLSDIESLPKSLLFWRSETHWLGGMGIIVLVLAIFPNMKGKKFLFEAEAPISPDDKKLFPKLTDVARTYWKIYMLFTIAQIILLLPVMDLFDSVTHSFASIAGGGFSTKNNSIQYFDSVYVEIILSFFMLAGATSFILHYYALKGKFYRYIRNSAFVAFMLVVLGTTIFITINLVTSPDQDYSFFGALRASYFQIVSLITTTGFATADFKYWPAASQILLIALMFIGGMSASTSGAIKISRIEIVYKYIKTIFIRLLHPTAVTKIQIGKHTLRDENINRVLLFVYSYIAIFIISGISLMILGSNAETSFTAVAATLGNVGPGIGDVGPFDNFMHFPETSKLILSTCMIIGRLEIWTVVLSFTPEFWMV